MLWPVSLYPPKDGALLFSMEFFRSGANRIIFPNQPYPDRENADHSHFQCCLPVRLRNSILGSSLPGYVCPERKIIIYSSRFSCAGRIAFPHIFPWSRPPGERDRSRTVHIFLCRQQGFLPAHTPMVMPARQGLRSLYQVFAAHRAAMAAVNKCSGRGNLFPNRRCIYYTISAEK